MILHRIDPFVKPSFTLRNRIARLMWGVVYTTLFKPSPRVFHGWRAFLLRAFGAKLGRNCHIYPRARIWAPWNLSMGNDSGMDDDVNCYSMALVSIGDRVVISQGTFLCTGTHDHEDERFQLQAKPITVGSHAWIAAQAFIAPGVTIGEGTVVGARAVVTKDMPPWTLCVGHPCRPIRARKRAGR